MIFIARVTEFLAQCNRRHIFIHTLYVVCIVVVLPQNVMYTYIYMISQIRYPISHIPSHNMYGMPLPLRICNKNGFMIFLSHLRNYFNLSSSNKYQTINMATKLYFPKRKQKIELENGSRMVVELWCAFLIWNCRL